MPNLAEIRRLAEQGGVIAQYDLATMYEKGKGVPKDCAEAMKWYRKAAEQGFPPAQLVLGWMCDQGEDYTEAEKWYRKAAEHGDSTAQYNLGLMYAKASACRRTTPRA